MPIAGSEIETETKTALTSETSSKHGNSIGYPESSEDSAGFLNNGIHCYYITYNYLPGASSLMACSSSEVQAPSVTDLLVILNEDSAGVPQWLNATKGNTRSFIYLMRGHWFVFRGCGPHLVNFYLTRWRIWSYRWIFASGTNTNNAFDQCKSIFEKWTTTSILYLNSMTVRSLLHGLERVQPDDKN